MVVIVIIGIIGTAIVPLFRTGQHEPKEFAGQLNEFMLAVWQEALTDKHIYRVNFYLEKNRIKVFYKQEITAEEKDGFIPVTQVPWKPELAIPSSYEIINFYIENKDEMAASTERGELWFYITPAGLAQPVIINIIDRGQADDEERIAQQFSLVLNPFSVQFEYYDTFQRP